jgi:hypothetical protein
MESTFAKSTFAKSRFGLMLYIKCNPFRRACPFLMM